MAGPSANRDYAAVVNELLQRASLRPPALADPPHIRSARSADGLAMVFVAASIPVWLIGLWNLGFHALQSPGGAEATALGGWQGRLFAAAGITPDATSMIACWVLGLLYHLPLLVTALGVGAWWEVVFARIRGRPADLGWLAGAWLFAMLLPIGVSPLLAGVSLSFGMVFGVHIFGGTGRYLVSPALLGTLFLQLGYPEVAEATLPISGSSVAGGWSAVISAGTQALDVEPVLLPGGPAGAVGAGIALACLAGAAYLVWADAISWRVPLAAILGLLGGLAMADFVTADEAPWRIPWLWHLAAGNFAFGVAFIATDPSAGPLTRSARWAYGLLIGLLTVAARVLDPAHPEGSLYAILLAGLAVPFMDYLALRPHRRRVAQTEVPDGP